MIWSGRGASKRGWRQISMLLGLWGILHDSLTCSVPSADQEGSLASWFFGFSANFWPPNLYFRLRLCDSVILTLYSTTHKIFQMLTTFRNGSRLMLSSSLLHPTMISQLCSTMHTVSRCTFVVFTRLGLNYSTKGVVGGGGSIHYRSHCLLFAFVSHSICKLLLSGFVTLCLTVQLYGWKL